jgi:UDP-glucose:glycoprotein glucosyltransferase
VQALGLTKDLALQAPQAQRALLVFNGRKLFLDAAASFHPTDLELLGQLEEKRVGSRAFDELFREMERRERSSRPQSGLTDQLQRFRAASLQRALLSSYVLAKRRASGGSRAVDVGEVIRSSFPEDSSALLYQLEAPASDYWDNANDLEIFFVLDPLSTGGQRAVSLIELFREHLHFSLTALVVPRPETTEFPLQNFYRFVSAPHLAHSVPATDAGEGETAAEFVGITNDAAASFTQLPRQHVLTTRVDIPEPWNVQTARAVQDIDNLRCSAQRCGDSLAEGERARDLTRVGYTLKNLLVAGQCFQAEADQVERLGSPPNGLQLTLSSLGQSAAATVSDTLVMQNLGYYQLQAQPGLYLLRLAEGRASDLFTIKDTELLGGRIIAVKSFGDLIRRLLVVKRRGFEQFSLLDDTPLPTADQDAAESAVVSTGGASFWQRVTSSLSLFSGESGAGAGAGAVTGPGAVSEDDKIHIFSLATGHLYERFLRIMMLSVVKHSSRPVKFWLFENYLSPKFKQIAQLMSRRYGFEVGYVTYKWPQWLRQQTQQQRIIWGYKILFLDVLFPLHLKKVIYVDADQVVRSDLAELWDLDLEGAPYGYTPFCTSRQETLGFQFWRQGYWKDHLQGRPYHISALYVVDLQTFRRQVVGDTLRAIYDQLSRDPNSLANLDQDLPNYAQHQVPIFSLPQSFLWCESWCSDKSKSQAKTIDLCNNPLHKEPKLEMAKR